MSDAIYVDVRPRLAQLDHEDLWDAHQCVLDWRNSDNCDDTPEHRERLLALANRLKDAANAIVMDL